MSDEELRRKLHFEPSTIETIDKSVLNYMDKLDLFANSNDGWKKVPIIWASAERAYQVKRNKDLRRRQASLRQRTLLDSMDRPTTLDLTPR